jgi:chemotaxis protein histidine kinase CheA
MTRDTPIAIGEPGSLEDRLLALAERMAAMVEAVAQPEKLEEARGLIRELRVELEDVGRRHEALAIERLGLLTEVWECLAAEGAASSGELALFCMKAATQLSRCAGPGGAEAVADWIFEQSSSSWGDYLGLLEPSPSEPEETDASAEPAENADSAPIDAQALLRLFTGAPATAESGGGRREIRERPAAPASPTERSHTVEDARGVRQPAAPPSPSMKLPELPPRVVLDDELRQAFLGDSTELVERIEPLVLGLGRGDDDGEALHELGRCLHTLKGAAGSVGIADLATLIHALEERIEASSGQASPDLIDLLHQTLGYLDGLLGWLRQGAATKGGEPSAGGPPAGPTSAASATEGGASFEREDGPVPTEGAKSSVPVKTESTPDGLIRIPSSRFDELADVASELVARRGLWTAQAEALKSIETMIRNCRQRMAGVLDRLHDAGVGREKGPALPGSDGDVAGLMRRLGELADDLAAMADTARTTGGPLADRGQSMARLTFQLWDELQSVRVVPIRSLFQRLVRVAYDAARVEGRQVEVVMAGEETGVDRALLDKAFEPLLHVVRNAVGHGIEPAEERAASGKPGAGTVRLEATREGNTLLITVEDDGRGLNHEAIAAKARRLGLLSPGEEPGVERLNALIFHPGFSTKEQASTISGRGVGMDVVAREVGLLKGTIDLQTRPGRGTRLMIRLPARLALETTMIVRVDGQAFAVPIAQIDSAQALEDAGGTAGPEVARGQQTTFALSADRHIPVAAAREILGIPGADGSAWPKLLVVRTAGGPVALMVDSIEGTEELVIKPLCGLLAGHPWISGTSQSLSGEVISILNLTNLHRWAGAGSSAAHQDDSAGCDKGPSTAPVVLVADDSLSVRRTVVRQLRNLGMEVEEVADGLEALGRLRSRPYALVVTDLEMPRLDGFGLLAEIRRCGPLAAVPVVVASTRSDDETRRRVAELGANAFLSKPVDPHALAAALAPLTGPAGG